MAWRNENASLYTAWYNSPMPLAAAHDLWSLLQSRQAIDPDDLAGAISVQLDAAPHDYRTRLLIHDALLALQEHWPASRFDAWLSRLPQLARALLTETFEDQTGFPSLKQRIMNITRPEQVERFLRELGTLLPQRRRIVIGGSIALILATDLSRHTEDIDVVDEVPVEIRSLHGQLDSLAQRYGLRITHFQSHYLPAGWESRTRSLGLFGNLEVHLVDVYDVCVSKLMSPREKDLDDLRQLVDQLDRSMLERRVAESAGAHLADAKLAATARRNWYILFGQELPSAAQ